MPLGELEWQGEPVDPRAIRRTDAADGRRRARRHLRRRPDRWPRTICAPGCGPICKRHHMQAGVGHYGVFSGNRWDNQIYPLVKNVILASE